MTKHKPRIIDHLSSPCPELNCDGIFIEKYIHNDWEGTLNCSNCDREIKRRTIGVEITGLDIGEPN